MRKLHETFQSNPLLYYGKDRESQVKKVFLLRTQQYERWRFTLHDFSSLILRVPRLAHVEK